MYRKKERLSTLLCSVVTTKDGASVCAIELAPIATCGLSYTKIHKKVDNLSLCGEFFLKIFIRPSSY